MYILINTHLTYIETPRQLALFLFFLSFFSKRINQNNPLPLKGANLFVYTRNNVWQPYFKTASGSIFKKTITWHLELFSMLIYASDVFIGEFRTSLNYL